MSSSTRELAHSLQALMDKLDRDLEYAISVECKTPLEDVADYEQVSSSSHVCWQWPRGGPAASAFCMSTAG